MSESTPSTPQGPTYDDLYAFLREHYKHERFEGRNVEPYLDYSATVTRSALALLERYGYCFISRHEAARCVGFAFDRTLRELSDAEIQAALRGGLETRAGTGNTRA